MIGIIERLRFWGTYGVSKKDLVKYSNEAADAIERLLKDKVLLHSAMRNAVDLLKDGFIEEACAVLNKAHDNAIRNLQSY